MRTIRMLAGALALALLPAPAVRAEEVPKATPEEAKAWVAALNAELKELFTRQAKAEWIKSTYITDDTEFMAAAANEEAMAVMARAVKESLRFDGLALDPETARAIKLLRVTSTLPAPNDPAKRRELAATMAKLEGIYGKGKYCDAEGKCRDLQELSAVMAENKNPDPKAMLEAWVGWHTISPEMRPLYERLMALGNEGAREIGFKDMGELWRSGYDMTPAQFEKETDRLWEQVKPLYESLHCYVRAQLGKRYGAEVVPAKGPIPAHLLGNMWAQEWANLYPMMTPFPGEASLDVDGALQGQGYDALKMVKMGEGFFTSLGFDALPESFWQRSQLVKPRDRDVVCHASAWDVTYDNDLRIKMCIKPTEEDLVTIHHELGHIYYFNKYYTRPVLFQQGANDGFHEAIGDAIALSITPGYLKKMGLIEKEPAGDKGLINVQLKSALERVAFLPFGKLIDQWRWDVESGKITAANYNKAWWELRRKYQGVDAPVARSEADFDPGAKYHVPANVPYTRYFLARILQFQFHKALCDAAGHKGPLHTCSIYGNKVAGEKLGAMLAMGASRPWPEAMEAITGKKGMDGSAMLEYYKPLMGWLKKQNKGLKCGW